MTLGPRLRRVSSTLCPVSMSSASLFDTRSSTLTPPPSILPNAPRITRERSESGSACWAGPPPSGSGPRPRLDVRELVGQSICSDLGVVGRLGTQPVAVGKAEEAAQAQVGVGGHGTPAGDDLADALRGHTDLLGEAILREAHRQKKLLAQQLAG